MPRQDDPSRTGHTAPTTDALRERIDSGETGDKVDYPDLAAAPLGTDDEAAGTPPDGVRRMSAQDGELQPVGGKGVGPWTMLAVALGVVVVVAAGVLLFGQRS